MKKYKKYLPFIFCQSIFFLLLLSCNALKDNMKRLCVPTFYEYARIADHVYQKHITCGEEVRIEKTKIPVKSKSWRIIEVFDKTTPTNFFEKKVLKSALYLSKDNKHIVWAHRGIPKSDSRSWYAAFCTIIFSVFQNKPASQTNWFKISLIEKVLNICQAHQAKLTLTGHSLGGFLASLAYFYLLEYSGKKDDYLVVNFDPVSAKSFLLKNHPKLASSYLSDARITNLLAPPNCINTYIPQIGKNHQLIFDRSSHSLFELQKQHSIKRFLASFDFGKPKTIQGIEEWPQGFQAYLAFVESQDLLFLPPSPRGSNPNLNTKLLGSNEKPKFLYLPLNSIKYLVREFNNKKRLLSTSPHLLQIEISVGLVLTFLFYFLFIHEKLLHSLVNIR